MKFRRTTAASAAGLIALAGFAVAPAATAASASDTTASGTTESGTGTLAVSLSSPRVVEKQRNVKMSCTSGSSYVMLASAAGQRGSIRASVSVPEFTGPGSYTAKVRVRVVANGKTRTRTASVPVTITSTGGTVSLDRTIRRSDKLLVGTVTWTCPTAPAA